MNHMFYFLLALTVALAATVNAIEPVLDTDGDIIIDGSYYVLPRISGPGGGGLSLTSRGGNWCPLYIGLEYSEVNRGIPVKFSDWMITVVFIPESTSLNIQMDVAATICGQSTYWYDRRHWDICRPAWRSTFGFKLYAIPGCVHESYCDRGISQDYVYCLREIID